MKKQFFRVKQLADQKFSRVGKTEALSEDLVIAEKRIDCLNKLCQNITKKIMSTLLGQGQDSTSREKRLRKCNEYVLAVLLFESGTGDIDETMKDILVECSKIQLCLANAASEIDARTESSVILPLQQIIDTDVPNIIKQKRYLTRLILDMDSARNRYQTALKHTSSSSSVGNIAKADSIREELEDIEMKVEQCRDTLACDMFQLVSKEGTIANVLLEYTRLQQTFHQTAVKLLDELVPQLQMTIENNNIKPVFGTPLGDHLKITNRKIAYPLELCVCILLEFGMEEEGLFRIAGGTSKVRRLKFGLDANFITLETALEYRDVHVISSVLKSYFRELPEPLLTYSLYDEWLFAIRVSDENTKLSSLWTVLHKLPQPNMDNLRYFIKFLSLLTKNQEHNKMNTQNLAIVIAPNLIWSRDNSTSNIGENMNLASYYSTIVECLIKYADWFFPGKETFCLTLEEMRNKTKGHTRSNSADLRLLSEEFANTSELGSIKRCQSTTNLEEQIPINPLPESPKPAARTRKNKPAPIPPSIAHTAIPAKDKSNSNVLKSTNAQQYSKKLESHDCSYDNEEILVRRRESFNCLENLDKTDTIDDENDENKKRSIKDLKLKYSLDENLQQSFVPSDSTNLLSVESINKILENKKSQKPTSISKVSPESQLRTSEEIPLKKPAIPEKPTSLQHRPLSSSFKSFKISDTTIDLNKLEGDKNEGPSLEKAHLYSVNKQQVAFVDISSNTSIQENPQKSEDSPEQSKSSKKKVSTACNVGSDSSHLRRHYDDESIENTSTGITTLHRSFHRIQRPIPPPPPPPTTAKVQSPTKSINDSTDL